MSRPKILIVEDDCIVAEDLQNSITKMGLAVAGIATSGAEALARVNEIRADLVLMDIVLKGAMTGIETAEQVRTLYNIPVVYLTAHSDGKIFEQAKKTGPFGYLLKPFDERELYVSIQIALYKHQIEEELKASRESFHNIVVRNKDGILILDQNRYVQFCNPAAENLLGRKADALLNYEFGFPFDPGKSIDAPIVHTNGKPVCLEISATDSRWQGKNSYLLTLRDITRRKQTEKDLAESERRFRRLIEHALVCILIIQDENIVYQNPQMERLFGNLAPPFGLQKFIAQLHRDDVVDLRNTYGDLFSGKVKSMNIVVRLYPLHKKGIDKEIKWMQCAGSLIEYRAKAAVLLNMADITKIKELEQMIVMREKMASLGHVAAGIAHEIRNPLSGVMILLDAIKDSLSVANNNEEIGLLINDAKEAAHKIESVIKRVGDFARPGTLQLTRMCVNEAIEEAAKLVAVSLQKAGITLEKELQKDLPEVFIDCHMLEQVLLNLLINSVEAMKTWRGTKKIRITSSSAGPHVIISFADTGPGIPNNIKSKIFDPFFTTKANGSGIGLSICHRIITDHGGTIGVNDWDNGGAEFTIRIKKEEDMDNRI